LALDKYGVNLFNTYQFTDNIHFDFSMGLQRSKVQKIYVEVINTPFTTEISETEYMDFQSRFFDGYLHLSYLKGYQNTLGVMGWEYDFNDFSFNLEYNLSFWENRFSFRPGISYRLFGIDDSLGRRNSSLGQGLVNGEKDLTTLGGSVYMDYRPADSLRFIAALRGDKYNHPDDKMYLSYQFAGTYQINENHLVRGVVSRANKGSNILDNYINFHFVSPTTEMHYYRNQDLELLTMDMVELGFRSKLTKNLHADLEIFYTKAKNYTSSTIQDSIIYTPVYKAYFTAKNMDVEPSQKGMTLALNYVMNEKFIFKPFITWQKTELKNLRINYSSSEKDLITEDGEYTPEWYGGFYLNIIPVERLNININSYLMSQTVMKYQYGKKSKIYNTWIVNSKISYEITKGLGLYINLKNFSPYQNIVNDHKKEYTNRTLQFGFADNIDTMIFFGLNVNI